MAKLPQFENEQPVMAVQGINSAASGFEAFAKAFGQTANDAESQMDKIETQASHTMFLQSQSQISDLENQAKLNIAQNPANAQKVLETTQQTADQIKKSAYINKQDRVNLNYITDNTLSNLKFSAQKQQIELAKQQAVLTTLNTFNTNNDKFSQALWSSDPKEAEIMQNAMAGSIRGQVGAGIITGVQGAAMMKSMDDEIKRHQAFLRGANQGNLDANGYHTLNAFTTDSLDTKADLPANELTTQIYQGQREYAAAADIRSAYARGENVNPISYRNISSIKEVETLGQYKYGAASGIGMATSGEAFPVIEHEIKRLNSISVPSEVEKGRRDYLNNYVNDIKNGNGLKYVLSNPLGAQAAKEYQTNVAAINNQPLDGETKQRYLNDAHNDFLTSVNHVYESMHVPEQYRNIFSPGIKQALESNLFSPQGNVNSGLQIINSVKKDALPYLANSMSDPHKATVVYTLGRLKGIADNSFLSNLALTQQDGINYEGLQQHNINGVFSNAYSNDKITNKLESNSQLSQVLELQKNFPRVNGVTANQAMIDMGVKYIKGMAVLNKDYQMNKFKTYLNDFVTNVSRGFDVVNQSNYTIDRKVVPLNDLSMDQVARGVLRQSYKTLFDQGYSLSQIEEMYSVNPYKVISTPTGHLVVIDSQGKKAVDRDGHVLFDMPFQTTMVHDAQAKDGIPILPVYEKRKH